MIISFFLPVTKTYVFAFIFDEITLSKKEGGVGGRQPKGGGGTELKFSSFWSKIWSKSGAGRLRGRLHPPPLYTRVSDSMHLCIFCLLTKIP